MIYINWYTYSILKSMFPMDNDTDLNNPTSFDYMINYVIYTYYTELYIDVHVQSDVLHKPNVSTYHFWVDIFNYFRVRAEVCGLVRPTSWSISQLLLKYVHIVYMYNCICKQVYIHFDSLGFLSILSNPFMIFENQTICIQ